MAKSLSELVAAIARAKGWQISDFESNTLKNLLAETVKKPLANRLEGSDTPQKTAQSTNSAALPAHLAKLLEPPQPDTPIISETVVRRSEYLERSKSIALELHQAEPDAWLNSIPSEGFQDGTRLKRPPRAKPLFTEIEVELESHLDQARDRVAFDSFALEQEAQKLVSLILTAEHRALLHQNIPGKNSAARIVEAILLLVARQCLHGIEAEYVACTAKQIAEITGLSLSTINHTLSQGRKGKQGDPNLQRWFSWKSVYGGEEQGINGRRIGTLFRVSLCPRDLADPTPAPVAPTPAFDVAKAHLLKASKTEKTVSNTLDSFNCKKQTDVKTFSKQQENANPQLLCFGDTSFQALVQSSKSFQNNNCKSHRFNVQFVVNTAAEARANRAMDKLGDDESNFPFWYGLFKKASDPKSKVNEHQVWAVISDSLDAKSRGMIKHSSTAGYAIGALIRAGLVQQAAQQPMLSTKLETIQI